MSLERINRYYKKKIPGPEPIIPGKNTFTIFNNYVVGHYTIYGCEVLAYHISKRVKNSGVYYVTNDGPNDFHYLVKINDHFVDITGIKTSEEVIEYWNIRTNTKTKLVKKEDIDHWNFYVNNTIYIRGVDHSDAKSVAKIIISRFITQ